MVFLIIGIPSEITGFFMERSIVAPATKILISNLVTLILTIVAIPINMTGQTLLYFDLRIRKEAFDIEVMASNLARESAGAGV